jgi:hypothetical protein
MTAYINELLQESLNSNEDYSILSEIIYKYIKQNDESLYEYIIDAIQAAIIQYADKFIIYQECENIYLTIKGFESIYNN